MLTLTVYFQLLYLTELPGCLFELDQCAWEPSDKWRMSKLFPLKSLEKDWQNTLGTYLSPCVLINQIKHFPVNSLNVIFCRRIHIFARLFMD